MYGSLLMFVCFFLPILALNGALAALPQVDFDRMGKVGLAGAFAGLDFFQDSSPQYDPSTSTLFTRSPKGTLTRLASTNQGGRINTACSLNNRLYVAGSFSSLNDNGVNNIASYSLEDENFSELGGSQDGPNGEVDTVFCDEEDGKVWVGGTFSRPGFSVAVWDVKANAWSRAPFGGLRGAQSRVSSITTNSTSSSLFFTGSFITSFGNGSTILNGTSNPNLPTSSGATPFSSSLVPFPLEASQVEGSPSSDDPQFNSIANILCPIGPDGPGNTWFGGDGNGGLITIRTFTSMSVSGVRLGNTFQQNHGTSTFSVTTIPDNGVQVLSYVDPETGENMTCSTSCPLSTDSGVLYQDFLFPEALSITGVQIQLIDYIGISPGLHILQLLSSGAFASAIDSNNGVSCFAPNPSTTTRTGEWVGKRADTDIAGTTQIVLVSSVAAGTPPSSGPSFTWMPYVSASGQYDINLLVPGCTRFQDCDRRTSVRLTVFPGSGLEPQVTTVFQTNTEDATTLIYSGPILPSPPMFVTTITMVIEIDGTSGSGPFEIVADRVQLVLKSADATSTSIGNGTYPGLQGSKNGFGFFEWPRSFALDNANGTTVFPENLETALDGIGFDIMSAIGVSSLTATSAVVIAAVAHHTSGIYLAGNFSISSGSSNIAKFSNGELIYLPDGGLNGEVTSLLVVDDQLFVGGSFNNTVNRSAGGGLRGLARYDITQNSWNSLAGGVDGRVSALSLTDDHIQIAGHYQNIFNSDSLESALPAAGLASWNIASETWSNTGSFILGRLSFVGKVTDSLEVVAGEVSTAKRYGASGLIMLQNGDDNEPEVVPLGVQLASPDISSANSSTNLRRSLLHSTARSHHRLARHLLPRQSNVPSLLPSPAVLAPAVLAGAFWTNITTSNEVVIIGGNFTFNSQSSQAVAIYDPKTATIQPLQGPQILGVVYSILVDGSNLYIGGQFTIPGLNINGLAIYDLGKNAWSADGLQPLQAQEGKIVSIRSISKSGSNPGAIYVAGSFARAGSLACEGICKYDPGSKQWNALGNGIQGEVASISYAGNDRDVIIAVGSLALPSKGEVNVAQYSISNSTWAAVGSASSLPGPVTAVEVNNGNSSSIFAAGRSADGSSSFLSYWDGSAWSILDTGLQPNTTVSQLTMVPLQNTHDSNGIIEQDRMLMVSGILTDSTFGSASSALFDGQNLIPYIVSESATGATGMVAAIFRSFATFSFNQRRFLGTGIVILISIAIATGVVFLLALIGILWTLLSRRDDKITKFDGADDEDDESIRHRPSSLLEHINAATRTTIMGTSPFSNFNAGKEEEKLSRERTPEPDPFVVRADSPPDVLGTILPEETSRVARARYAFEAQGEGELSFEAYAELEILDDKDNSWWYARDPRTGLEGIVPASYLY